MSCVDHRINFYPYEGVNVQLLFHGLKATLFRKWLTAHRRCQRKSQKRKRISWALWRPSRKLPMPYFSQVYRVVDAHAFSIVVKSSGL